MSEPAEDAPECPTLGLARRKLGHDGRKRCAKTLLEFVYTCDRGHKHCANCHWRLNWGSK